MQARPLPDAHTNRPHPDMGKHTGDEFFGLIVPDVQFVRLRSGVRATFGERGSRNATFSAVIAAMGGVRSMPGDRGSKNAALHVFATFKSMPACERCFGCGALFAGVCVLMCQCISARNDESPTDQHMKQEWVRAMQRAKERSNEARGRGGDHQARERRPHLRALPRLIRREGTSNNGRRSLHVPAWRSGFWLPRGLCVAHCVSLSLLYSHLVLLP